MKKKLTPLANALKTHAEIINTGSWIGNELKNKILRDYRKAEDLHFFINLNIKP